MNKLSYDNICIRASLEANVATSSEHCSNEILISKSKYRHLPVDVSYKQMRMNLEGVIRRELVFIYALDLHRTSYQKTIQYMSVIVKDHKLSEELLKCYKNITKPSDLEHRKLILILATLVAQLDVDLYSICDRFKTMPQAR